MSTEKPKIWAGFWRRLGAWIIDNIILAIVCYGFAFAASDIVMAWGSNGRAFGLALGILYFGLTGSGLLGGRTVGMRAMDLKVVTLKGRPLGLLPALGRAVLLVGPLMLNGWSPDIQGPMQVQVFQTVAIVAVFGILAAQVYLFLFNWPTRRLVHDLVFGAVVVRSEVDAPEAPKSRVHTIVAGLLVLAVTALAIVAPYKLQSLLPASFTKAVNDEQKVVDAVNALPEVSETGVLDNTNTFYQSGQPPKVTRTLIVTAQVRARPAHADVELARIGAAAVKAYKFAPDQRLQVKIVYGYDLGFGSYNNFESNFYSTTCTAADVSCLDK